MGLNGLLGAVSEQTHLGSGVPQLLPCGWAILGTGTPPDNLAAARGTRLVGVRLLHQPFASGMVVVGLLRGRVAAP